MIDQDQGQIIEITNTMIETKEDQEVDRIGETISKEIITITSKRQMIRMALKKKKRKMKHQKLLKRMTK